MDSLRRDISVANYSLGEAKSPWIAAFFALRFYAGCLPFFKPALNSRHCYRHACLENAHLLQSSVYVTSDSRRSNGGGPIRKLGFSSPRPRKTNPIVQCIASRSSSVNRPDEPLNDRQYEHMDMRRENSVQSTISSWSRPLLDGKSRAQRRERCDSDCILLSSLKNFSALAFASSFSCSSRLSHCLINLWIGIRVGREVEMTSWHVT